jgi:P-loop containing dynein motor region D4
VRTSAHEHVSDGTELTPLELFAFFVRRCRSNLHIIIAFSPIGDAFRNRLRQYPSLINCCTIDWFQVCTITLIPLNLFLIPCLSSSASLCAVLFLEHLFDGEW